MTTDAPRGKAAPPAAKTAPRHVYGPRTIGAILPVVTRPSYRKGGVALGQLLADWPSLVGPGLAATTTPRRLAAGTLTLGCAGPVALELQHLAGPLMERINGGLGRAAIQRLRFVQEAPRPVPPPAPPRPRPGPAVPIPGLPEGPLRDALAALGAALRADRS